MTIAVRFCVGLLALATIGNASFAQDDVVTPAAQTNTEAIGDGCEVKIEVVEIDHKAMRKAGVDWNLTPANNGRTEVINESFIPYIKVLEHSSIAKRFTASATVVKADEANTYSFKNNNQNFEVKVQSQLKGEDIKGSLTFNISTRKAAKPHRQKIETGFECRTGKCTIINAGRMMNFDDGDKSHYILLTYTRPTVADTEATN